MRSETSSTSLLPSEYSAHLKRQGFELISMLGQGLSGSVYRAHQKSLDRDVAVKFFDSAFVRDDASMRKRFVREAKLLAKFQHPNIPYVLTEGTVETNFGVVPYFAMEYVQGITLRELLLSKAPLTPPQALDLIKQILDALGYAHERQIIHRDVKPANVMVDARRRVFLIDFSIGVSLRSDPGLTRATTQGEVLGTPPYCAPEQSAAPSTVDGRADLYSVGVMLFELLCGSTDLTNVARALAGMPRTLVVAIEKVCAQNPASRPASAAEFIRALGPTSQVAAPRSAPALALCSNTKCPAAEWTANGYYKGPMFESESKTSYCTSCGESLVYTCSNCSAPISRTPFCGACGHEIYQVPECKACGSWLKKLYMGVDTTSGCGKCLSKVQDTKSRPSIDDFDDDIPF